MAVHWRRQAWEEGKGGGVCENAACKKVKERDQEKEGSKKLGHPNPH